MEKERLHYIDVAKGILIIMVVYGHIYGVLHQANIENNATNWIHQSCNLFVSFYMPAFFVITGFCSNFRKSFLLLLFQSFKTIVLPGITISLLLNIRHIDHEFLCSLAKKILLYGGSYWFLSSLFLAKIFYWVVINKVDKIRNQIIIGILLFIIGLVTHFVYDGPELWWFIHALCLAPFIGMGILLKKREISFIKAGIIFVTAFVITIVFAHVGILKIDYFYHVPAITLMLININQTMIVSLVLLSITGSLVIFKISKYISSNRILEYLGKNSLIIYCIHVPILSILVRKYVTNGGGLIIALLFVTTIIICCAISFVLNLKYIRVLIGKF